MSGTVPQISGLRAPGDFSALALSAGEAARLASTIVTQNIHGNVSPATLRDAQIWLDGSTHVGEQVALASQPATEAEIKSALSGLIACFNPKEDLSVFGRFLASDVWACKPSKYALQVGIAKIRTSAKFRPSIAEVLHAIKGAEAEMTMFGTAVRVVPGYIERARKPRLVR